ncbi:hypothetical protein QYF36_020403 [Acer negundo]|nr:hypothetical protein QYF36_020403 [Acer negundo]
MAGLTENPNPVLDIDGYNCISVSLLLKEILKRKIPLTILLPNQSDDISHLALDIGGMDSRHWNAEAPANENAVIKATGGGAFKFADLFKERLGVGLDKEDEMDCLLAGANFLLKAIRHEAFTQMEGRKEFVQIDHNDLFPYLLVNIGSGVSMIKVDGDGKFQQISWMEKFVPKGTEITAPVPMATPPGTNGHGGFEVPSSKGGTLRSDASALNVGVLHLVPTLEVFPLLADQKCMSLTPLTWRITMSQSIGSVLSGHLPDLVDKCLFREAWFGWQREEQIKFWNLILD